MRRTLAPRRKTEQKTRESVQAVVDETIALYRWLAWVADELYGDDAKGATRRWALRRLKRDGPTTVSKLARARAVRRQSLQPVVDHLASDGLVELVDNPAHARSPLVRVSTKGGALVARLDRIDRAVLRAVGRRIDPGALETTAATLQTLRSGFETRMRWHPAADAARERD